CMCDTGWNAATSCSSCASGFKGTACDECKSNRYGPNCLVCPLSCGAHGSCDQGITGSGGCNCDDHWTGTTCTQCATGYTGADCNTCAAGYQDNDTNGSCTPTCATAACESGTCIDLSGTATCLDPADYASCAALLSAFPGAPSGPYAIDPDGEGGNDALNVNCDMVTDGGGWTQVSIEDFSSGTATGWTNNTVDSSSTCATVYGPMLGGFGNFAGTSVTKTYNLGGVPHTEVSASLTYYVIDSWDGETASVTLGGSSIFSQTFNHLSASVNTCGGGWPEFGAQAVSGTIAHNAATVDLVAGSTLNQAASDESWGISDIVISVR
ncbi:MAG: hypothetical protein KC417_03815, partial [Myxococcales bacterium]|nr:hypothetical protein [Myxococcales bacterium]